MRGRISSTASAGSSSATCAGLFTGNQSVARIVVRNALEHFGQPPAVAAQADDADPRAVQVARRAADEFACLLCAEERRQARSRPVSRAIVWSATWFGQHAGGAR